MAVLQTDSKCSNTFVYAPLLNLVCGLAPGHDLLFLRQLHESALQPIRKG